ncbi:response regulator [Actimicrobium sp. CCC2.4]|uniref:response regulator n=1 Tax=Actimicrobium sp. CCC2.4 TaxID=3048606 RepID=UPI002AC91E9E|nr:response regulator [Actimicrobium sp. CCC2.4]MEB0136402.1 response regulator [Actimicrobium sp. CCC2.4]WPX31221.1 response regulator [Actimicrobium sp. CCC2.4]
MRLLYIEDDAMLRDSVAQGLQHEGHTVDVVADGNSGLLALTTHSYDLLLLDLGLPRVNGSTVLATLRQRGDSIPVLILTARDAIADRVRGLNAGADDYLVKPFDLQELAARVQALLRRRAGRTDALVRHGSLVLNTTTHAVTLDEACIALSAREFAVLHALLERPGAVLSVSQLEEKIYGWGDEVGSNTVEVYIHALRKKLGAGMIRNVRGVGYMMATLP